jgi:hypothetical protein
LQIFTYASNNNVPTVTEDTTSQYNLDTAASTGVFRSDTFNSKVDDTEIGNITQIIDKSLSNSSDIIVISPTIIIDNLIESVNRTEEVDLPCSFSNNHSEVVIPLSDHNL